MLAFENVTRVFNGRTAVNDVSLEIKPGSFVGVIGRSGAGKSTLLRMVNRLVDPTAGRIVFDGRPVTALRGAALRRWRASAAMIFQQFNLVTRLDVVSNVMLGRLNRRPVWRSLAGSFTDAERAEALALLERFGIAETALQRAGTLSGGQQQRVAIARAMMQQPELVLADEPIASLDPGNAGVVMDALRDINRVDGITVVTNLHTLDTARAYCTRIIGLSAGTVVFDGTPEELTDEVTQRLYGGQPLVAGPVTHPAHAPTPADAAGSAVAAAT